MSENLKPKHSAAFTRRALLKKASFAVAAASVSGVGSAFAREGPRGYMGQVPIIRIRNHIHAKGWTHYRVKTVNYNYPAPEGEAIAKTGVYGGDSRVKWSSNGKFRTEKINDRWWMVDPDGHPFVSVGMNGVRQGKTDKIRESVAAMGGEQQWSIDTVKQLRDTGFNTAGMWSTAAEDSSGQHPHKSIPYVFFDYSIKDDPELFPGKRPFGLMECFMARKRKELGWERGIPFAPFHPGFEDFCIERCKQVITNEVRDDKWLVGFFTDNELSIPPFRRMLEMNPDHPIYGGCVKEVMKWEQAQRKSGGAVDDEAWASHVLNWYLRVTTTAIRKYDKGHLQLGSRLFTTERNFEKVFETAGKYLDVVSVNPYGMREVSTSQMRSWSAWAGDKPLLIGEFYIKGNDSELSNDGGAGMLSSSQEDRGLYYQNYALGLMQSKVCVGWHWHQYTDDWLANDQGINKGLLRADLTVYSNLFNKMKALNGRLYNIIDLMSPV